MYLHANVQIAIFFREIAPDRPELISWLMATSGFGAFIIKSLGNSVNFL